MSIHKISYLASTVIALAVLVGSNNIVFGVLSFAVMSLSVKILKKV